MNAESFLKEELSNIHQEIKKHLDQSAERGPRFTYPRLDLFALLPKACAEKIFYFKSKYSDFTFLGLGHSKTIRAKDLQDFLKNRPDEFLIAALDFEAPCDEALFILPEWSFISQGDSTRLIINNSFEYKNYSLPDLFFNRDYVLCDSETEAWENYEEVPEHDQWNKIIDQSLSLFQSKELLKIVLSRKKIFEYAAPLDPLLFFNDLIIKNNGAKDCYAIFHQISFGKAFMSLTPEKLFSIKGNHFESIALAASAPRGETPESDKQFEEELLRSEKLVREHLIVKDEILNKVGPLSTRIKALPLETMKLAYIQHRSVPIVADLKENVSALDLIRLLHPTPAIGGLPSAQAKEKISLLEPYKRKSYAAPIGIISKSQSEIAVGIRSGLIERHKLTLFGGAGIVAGSVAEEEWIETGTKMGPFLKVVNNV